MQIHQHMWICIYVYIPAEQAAEISKISGFSISTTWKLLLSSDNFHRKSNTNFSHKQFVCTKGHESPFTIESVDQITSSGQGRGKIILHLFLAKIISAQKQMETSSANYTGYFLNAGSQSKYHTAWGHLGAEQEGVGICSAKLALCHQDVFHVPNIHLQLQSHHF